MIENNNPVEVARSIYEYGFVNTTAAFFLIVCCVMFLVFLRWFVKIINGIIKKQETTSQKILEGVMMLHEGQLDISEGLVETSMARTSTIFSMSIDNTVNEVCRAIKRIKAENHIDDRESTKEKIRRMVTNIHEARNSLLEDFRFRGKPLSAYTNNIWIDQIATVIEREVYDPNPNNGRMYSNVKLAYERISNEFSRNLRYK